MQSWYNYPVSYYWIDLLILLVLILGTKCPLMDATVWLSCYNLYQIDIRTHELFQFAVSEAVILSTLSYQEAWEMVRFFIVKNYFVKIVNLLSQKHLTTSKFSYVCSHTSGQMFCIHAQLFQWWIMPFLYWLEIFLISLPLEQWSASHLWMKMEIKGAWSLLSKHLLL